LRVPSWVFSDQPGDFTADADELRLGLLANLIAPYSVFEDACELLGRVEIFPMRLRFPTPQTLGMAAHGTSGPGRHERIHGRVGGVSARWNTPISSCRSSATRSDGFWFLMTV
jgi:hypothetical protein